MKRIVYFIVFFIFFNSCDDETKPITFKSTSIDTAFEADISASYDKATGKNDRSERINKNVEHAIVKTLSTPETKGDLSAVLNDFNSEFVAFKKDFPDASEPIWELNIETEVVYQSEDIITIAISTYEFKGGAHGNDNIKFLNLNAKTGATFKRSDLIKNETDFKIIAKSHFLSSLELETEDENLKIEDFFFGKPFQLPENIGFTEDGLVLLYNVYEVASYDQGYTEFVIPFDEAEPYLKVH